MISEKTFYRELADVPDLPDGLYEKIDRTIGRRRMFLRPLLAAAAALIVAAGVTAVLTASRPGGGAVSPELADELRSVNEYLNGNDLDEELVAYALDEYGL